MFISSGKLHPLWYSFQENDPRHIQNSTDKLPHTECVIHTMNGAQLLQSKFGINRARQKHISKHCVFKILSSLKSLKCERQINIICIYNFFFDLLISYEVCIYMGVQGRILDVTGRRAIVQFFSHHLSRLVSACLTILCMSCTKTTGILHAQYSVSTFQLEKA